MIPIDNKYNIGETVYLKTDPEQLERLVIAITINPHGLIYKLSCGNTFNDFYDVEISREKRYVNEIRNYNE